MSSTDQFQCAHGRKCIPQTEMCDGQYQCQDQSDEAKCRQKVDGCSHYCDEDQRCIPENFLCDGERDCVDGSDESQCGKTTKTLGLLVLVYGCFTS